MPKVAVINQKGEKTGEIELSENVYGVEINEHVVYEVVKNHLANKRQGTKSAKTRGEVSGGGRKPWRQKGTGRARQGSNRSPQWKGGGVVFAPKPRDYSYKLPKKVKRLALKSALTSKVQDEDMIVLDSLSIEEFSTKEAKKVLEAIGAKKKALIVLDTKDEKVIRSFKNLQGVQTVLAQNINVYDILNHDSFIITKDAVGITEEVFA